MWYCVILCYNITWSRRYESPGKCLLSKLTVMTCLIYENSLFEDFAWDISCRKAGKGCVKSLWKPRTASCLTWLIRPRWLHATWASQWILVCGPAWPASTSMDLALHSFPPMVSPTPSLNDALARRSDKVPHTNQLCVCRNNSHTLSPSFLR